MAVLDPNILYFLKDFLFIFLRMELCVFLMLVVKCSLTRFNSLELKFWSNLCTLEILCPCSFIIGSFIILGHYIKHAIKREFINTSHKKRQNFSFFKS